jgi:hypothetical protein
VQLRQHVYVEGPARQHLVGQPAQPIEQLRLVAPRLDYVVRVK